MRAHVFAAAPFAASLLSANLEAADVEIVAEGLANPHDRTSATNGPVLRIAP
jgi:hypothetical protein